MDLLGSILGSMEKPPTASDAEKKKMKADQEKLKKQQRLERQQKEKFRVRIEKIISNFINDAVNTRHRCKPMNKLERSIVHEMADVAGLTTQAFGKDEVDRYVMLFKKEHPASDQEIEAYIRGEEWSAEKEKETKLIKETAVERLKEQNDKHSSKEKTHVEPSTNYKDKYNHIIGKSSAKDAARKTKANDSFGMVPSSNKRDQRSIEETLNEIRAKKKKT